MQLFDPCTIDIESDHRRAGTGERYRHGQSNIAQAYYRNIASRCQNIPLVLLVSGFGVSRKSVSTLRIGIADAL
jgi:hypothetical protein